MRKIVLLCLLAVYTVQAMPEKVPTEAESVTTRKSDIENGDANKTEQDPQPDTEKQTEGGDNNKELSTPGGPRRNKHRRPKHPRRNLRRNSKPRRTDSPPVAGKKPNGTNNDDGANALRSPGRYDYYDYYYYNYPPYSHYESGLDFDLDVNVNIPKENIDAADIDINVNLNAGEIRSGYVKICS